MADHSEPGSDDESAEAVSWPTSVSTDAVGDDLDDAVATDQSDQSPLGAEPDPDNPGSGGSVDPDVTDHSQQSPPSAEPATAADEGSAEGSGSPGDRVIPESGKPVPGQQESGQQESGTPNSAQQDSGAERDGKTASVTGRRPAKRVPRGAGTRTRKSDKAKGAESDGTDTARGDRSPAGGAEITDDGRPGAAADPANESAATLFAVVDDVPASAPLGDQRPGVEVRSEIDDESAHGDDGTAADPRLTDDAPAADPRLTDDAPADAESAEGSPDEESPDEESLEAADSTDEASLGEEGEHQAPFAAAFGLLFQAPQPPPARRASRPSGTAVAVPSEPSPADEPPQHTAPDPIDEQSEEQPAPEDDGESADSGQKGSRRRRGGRGRRTRGEGDAAPEEKSEPEKTQDDEVTEPAAEAAAPEAEDEAGGARRRRRRRRSGAAGDEQDPPGTVTKVREARRDEPQAVRGSTRLEAKKLRRREGREAGRRRTIITEKEFLARRESVERSMVVRRIDGRTQIAVLEDGILVEHYVSRATNASMAGNVYLGRIQNVLPSMEAAFVDIGRGRNAVLYAGEVNWDTAGLSSGEPRRIENVLSSGESVLVQVTKDPIGHKGARLTSQVSLPGRYLVYVPEGNMTGISRKLPDTERSRLKAILREVVPADAGVIVRTAAEGASEDELRRDVERLARSWEKISAAAAKAGKKKAASGGAPTLLYAEPDLTVRVIRDVFNEDFASLVIAGDEVWEEISGYVSDVAPDLAPRMTKWTAEQDIFAANRVDEQLAKALDRKVYLPSGGSLVIDRTEAMTVVDVNTGRFVGSGGNLEETVTKNNLEAAEEIVRQLRLRDIGGIIVIDFIDMVLESNRELVVRRLLECLGRDRTKHQVAEVTSLGLVQMTRKRVASGLLEVFSETCEHCEGRGLIVRSAPVDKAASGSGEPASGSSGRGRRARQSATEPATPEPAKGPTAAQIAAAAHAAALKSLNRVEMPPPDEDADAAQDAPPDGGPATHDDVGTGSGNEPTAAEPVSDSAGGTGAISAPADADDSASGAPRSGGESDERADGSAIHGSATDGSTTDSVNVDKAVSEHPGSGDVHTGEVEPGEARFGEAESGQAGSEDARPEDARPEDSGPTDAPPAGATGRGRGRRRRGRATAPAGPPPAQTEN